MFYRFYFFCLGVVFFMDSEILAIFVIMLNNTFHYNINSQIYIYEILQNMEL
jgi:hypothetical protein